MISDTGSNISSAASSMTNKTGMNDMGNNMRSDINRDESIMSNDMATDGTNYTATRTGATTASGMNNSTLMWIILAVAAIAIIALVWYYGRQFEHSDME